MPSEFKIACGSNLNALATSLSFVGLFIGSYLAGFSDKYGRKRVIVIATGCSGAFQLLQGLLPTYPVFIVVRILVQAANQVAYITYNVYGKYDILIIYYDNLLILKNFEIIRSKIKN